MPGFCDLYDGFLGIFGEDGLEALHPKDSLCRRMVRQMRNPEARHKAHTRHLEAMTSTAVMDRVVHRRRSGNGGRGARGGKGGKGGPGLAHPGGRGLALANPRPWAAAGEEAGEEAGGGGGGVE